MLPLTFHRSFVPERRLLARLMDFAALGKEGTLKEISRETGIPMGESSGKAEAVMDYATAMGLILLEDGARRGAKRITLTDLGQAVYREDRYLGEALTQWILHFNMCRSDIGAKAWHEVFAKGRRSLGSEFTRAGLEDYLISVFGPGSNRIGPLLSTYTEDAALSRTRALIVEGDRVKRLPAPLSGAYWTPYCICVLSMLDAFFPGQSQVTISDFSDATLLFDMLLWRDTEIDYALHHMEQKGFIAVDRQMRPWILERRMGSTRIWSRLYEDAI